MTKTAKIIAPFAGLLFSAVLLGGCQSRGYDYDIPVAFIIDGLDANNIVQIHKGATSFRITGKVTSAAGIADFTMVNADARTGGETSSIDETAVSFADHPLQYAFDYTLTGIETDRCVRLKITDGNGEAFQCGMVVKITPTVEFTLERILESYDYWYGVHFATWLDGRIYKNREAEQWVAQVNISMCELDGKACLVSPAARTGLGLPSFEGARQTLYMATTMTADQYRTIKEVDATPILGFTPSLEQVEITAGTVYAYLTVDGRKGLIHVTKLTSATHRDLPDVKVWSATLSAKTQL